MHFTHFSCGITEDDVVDDETGEIFKKIVRLWCPLKRGIDTMGKIINIPEAPKQL